MAKYTWATQKKNITEVIIATHDPLKEWNPDSKGYFLIRVDAKERRIEVGYATNKHVINKVIHGTDAIAIYNTIVRKKLISRLEHAAYLGKELYKAELCLRYGKKYIQEAPLNFTEFKEKVILKVKS